MYIIEFVRVHMTPFDHDNLWSGGVFLFADGVGVGAFWALLLLLLPTMKEEEGSYDN
jgi:hypothetical protein